MFLYSRLGATVTAYSLLVRHLNKFDTGYKLSERLVGKCCKVYYPSFSAANSLSIYYSL